MDPIPIKILKFQAIHKNKRHQYHPMYNLFFYCLSAITCSLICSSPLWFPSFFSSMKNFFFGFVPMISSGLLSSKFVFVLGNLIVVALVGESKIFSTVSSPSNNIHVEYEESVRRFQRFNSSSIHIQKEAEKLILAPPVEERVVLLETTVCGDGDQALEGQECLEQSEEVVEEEEEEEEVIEDMYGDEEDEFGLPEDQQFNKRADDFIARVNERRRFELLLCNSE